MHWQPIETAPKDGTEILIFEPPFMHLAAWRFQAWAETCQGGIADLEPTHWMPLPEPPQ